VNNPETAAQETRETRASRKERTERFLGPESEETQATIYAHIANGGTLIDLCEVWDIRWSDVMAWIDKDPVRQKSFRDAMQARVNYVDELWISELTFLSRFDLRRLYDENGRLKPMNKLDAQTARAISGAEVDEMFGSGEEAGVQVGETKKVKLWDKLKALDMIGRHRGHMVEKHEVSGKLTLEDLVSGSYAKPDAPSPTPGPVAGQESASSPVVDPAPAPASALIPPAVPPAA